MMSVSLYFKEELNGKTLEIKTFDSSDGFIMIGRDPNSGVMYVLAHDPKVETSPDNPTPIGFRSTYK